MWESKAYKQRELWEQGKCTNLVASSLYANELRSLLRFCDIGLVVFVRTQFWQFCLRPSFGHINPTFLLCECTYRFPSSFDRFLSTLFSFGSYPHLTIALAFDSFRLAFPQLIPIHLFWAFCVCFSCVCLSGCSLSWIIHPNRSSTVSQGSFLHPCLFGPFSFHLVLFHHD